MISGKNELDFIKVELKVDKTLYSKEEISSPMNAVSLVGKYIKNSPNENFCMISLNTKGNIINASIVTTGTFDSTYVSPREVFQRAILSNAYGVILMHNHPSGNITPSAADFDTTKRIIKAGMILGIKVLDHIIVGAGNDEFYSFSEHEEIFDEFLTESEIDRLIKDIKDNEAMVNESSSSYGGNNLDELKRDVSIVDMARRLGLTPVRVGSRYYSLKEHDSVRIDTQNNRYIRNSTAEHGSVIDFVMNFERVSAAEAIKIIKDANGIYPKERPKDIPKKEKTKKALEIPEKDSHNKNVFAYLTKTRMLDAEIVNKAIKVGMLYQDTNKNCVFVSKDAAGKIRFINRRGTNTEKRFVQDMEGSDYTHSFFIDNKSKTLVLCESVIDAFSYMNLEKMKGSGYTDKSYISLSGVYKYEEALKYHLNRDNYEKIIIALDNDNGGKTGTENIISYINENFPGLSEKIEVDIPREGKDFNDELKAIKEKGILPASISERAKGENMNKEKNSDAKEKISVREYIEKYPEKTLNLITPGGYITIPSGYTGGDLFASNGAVNSPETPVNSDEILNQVFSSMDINEYKRETYIITEYPKEKENIDILKEPRKEVRNMSSAYNKTKTVLEGRLLKDPEYKIVNTPDGGKFKVCNMAIASYDPTGKTIHGKDGKEYKQNNIYNLTAYSDVADAINDRYKKGDILTVIARPSTNSYINKNGQKVTNMEYKVSAVDYENKIANQLGNLLNDFERGNISQLYENKSFDGPGNTYGLGEEKTMDRDKGADMLQNASSDSLETFVERDR